jgi:hypothetical protein
MTIDSSLNSLRILFYYLEKNSSLNIEKKSSLNIEKKSSLNRQFFSKFREESEMVQVGNQVCILKMLEFAL